ncbi:flagellar biosynthesis protein FlhB [Betaproteobacteria bacterium SCN2]|jgi:flagellar biosynthetic protein FlhB|nr:flagellar biosynthesis protein FlhB [Betaproteobacteria bacterium SCN2]
MAEESDYSRTEPASEKRRDQARAEGRVPRSAELSALLVVGAMTAALLIWGAQLFGRLQQLFAEHFSQAAQLPPQSALLLVQQSAVEILPFLAAVFVAALAAPLLLSGWVFAPAVVRFRGERLNPLHTVSRLFSAGGLFEAFKAVAKIALLALLLFVFYRMNLDALAGLPAQPLPQAVATAAGVLAQGFLLLLAAMLLAALLDVPWQWWRHLRNLAMTRAEVLAEAREAEGSPELKARIRARRQAMRLERAE